MSILKDAAEEQPNECRIIGGKPCSPFRLQFRQFTFANSFRKPLGPPRNENLTKDDDPPPATPFRFFRRRAESGDIVQLRIADRTAAPGMKHFLKPSNRPGSAASRRHRAAPIEDFERHTSRLSGCSASSCALHR